MAAWADIDRRFPWSFLGFLVGLLFGVVGIYSVFIFERRPELAVEVVSDAPVFSLLQPIPELEVVFQGKNIRETRQGLATIILTVANKGNSAIRPVDFDPKDPLTLILRNGEIIGADVVTPTDEYFESVFRQSSQQATQLVLPPFIMEAGQALNIRLLVLHDESHRPILDFKGRLANIRSIEVRQYVPPSQASTGSAAFRGSPLVQLLRVGAYGLGTIAAIVAGIALSFYLRDKKVAAREKELRARDSQLITRFLSMLPSDERAELEPFAKVLRSQAFPDALLLSRVLPLESSEALLASSEFHALLRQAEMVDRSFDARDFHADPPFVRNFSRLIELLAARWKVDLVSTSK